MEKVTFKKDLVFAAFGALVVHFGIAFCHISISSPPLYLNTENQHHLKILAVARIAEAERPPALLDVKKEERKTPAGKEKKITRPDISSRPMQKKEATNTKATEAVPRQIVETRAVGQPVTVRESTSTEGVEGGARGSPLSMADAPAPVERASPETAGEALAVPRYGENPPPVYPMIARRKGYEGVVLLSVEVLSNGRAGHVKIEKSTGYAVLDTSALKAVKEWKFEPARRMGTLVTVWVNVPVKFVLLPQD
ncbi:MAG: energy transducer TonB [Syntrophales bacterium]|nr:energy transducer TonB [Syntrophales bacterium]